MIWYFRVQFGVTFGIEINVIIRRSILSVVLTFNFPVFDVQFVWVEQLFRLDMVLMFELDKSVNLNKLVEFDNCLWTISWNFDEVWRVGKVRQNDPDVQASSCWRLTSDFMFKLWQSWTIRCSWTSLSGCSN